MKPKTREAVQSSLFEAFFVVLAVVLALFANEWREDRASRERAMTARRGIIEELAVNRAAMQSSFDYHRSILEALQSGGEEPSFALFPRGFVSPAQLQRTSWDTAAQTGVLEHMDYGDLLEFSRIYARQDRYEEQVAAISRIIYQELYRGGPASLLANAKGLLSLVAAFSYRERELLGEYEELLARKGAGS